MSFFTIIGSAAEPGTIDTFGALWRFDQIVITYAGSVTVATVPRWLHGLMATRGGPLVYARFWELGKAIGWVVVHEHRLTSTASQRHARALRRDPGNADGFSAELQRLQAGT